MLLSYFFLITKKYIEILFLYCFIKAYLRDHNVFLFKNSEYKKDALIRE